MRLDKLPKHLALMGRPVKDLIYFQDESLKNLSARVKMIENLQKLKAQVNRTITGNGGGYAVWFTELNWELGGIITTVMLRTKRFGVKIVSNILITCSGYRKIGPNGFGFTTRKHFVGYLVTELRT